MTSMQSSWDDPAVRAAVQATIQSSPAVTGFTPEAGQMLLHQLRAATDEYATRVDVWAAVEAQFPHGSQLVAVDILTDLARGLEPIVWSADTMRDAAQDAANALRRRGAS